jgi:hypothetical protein
VYIPARKHNVQVYISPSSTDEEYLVFPLLSSDATHPQPASDDFENESSAAAVHRDRDPIATN